ncbi:unnamed protein product [Candidula unifasciata]|uniref:Microtubule-associated protein Jupiter n=1 Tax=Candidula unifasciata TaxID=100452 RepID=A0A8S3ZTA4_9EUPU|nr:unnamed protein product [Candidula unifasciata]
MTTTHTFQGLNTDNKPSSRVLNPPGGSSSNIFGFGDQPKKQDTAKSNLEIVTKGTNDALTHGPPAATAGPQQKPGVPKSAFNPITGEPYEQSKPKQETPLPAAIPSESKSVVESTSVLESTGAVNIAEPEQTPTAAGPAPAIPSSAVQQKQQQNGPFSIGVAEDVKEHRSTRVTQPPGGRSTKLW